MEQQRRRSRHTFGGIMTRSPKGRRGPLSKSYVVRFMLPRKSAPLQPPSHDGAEGWTTLNASSSAAGERGK